MKHGGFVTLRGTAVGSPEYEYPIDVRRDVVEAVADYGFECCMLLTSGQNRLWVKGTRADIVAQLERGDDAP